MKQLTSEEYQQILDWMDRIASLERQFNQLNDVLKLQLAHQALNDSKLNDIIHVRHWWKRDPPAPADLELLQARVYLLEKQLAAWRKALKNG